MVERSQLSLLRAAPSPALPEGFKYQSDIIAPSYHETLVQQIGVLPFKAFEFRGFEGKRRVVSYGWRYDFNQQKLQEADPLPPFLLPIRDLAADFAGLRPEQLEQVSVIEYAPGSAIGWHRDRPMFEDVVGISLASPTRFRFRRQAGTKWERASQIVEPRSIYLLRGPSRREWEHSIPPVDTLRYSITLRSFGA
jgi:alkylated DNA repair dioxygenase AlkB